MLNLRVSVRTLAEFTTLAGDLSPSLQLARRMQEGATVHRMRQSAYPGGYEKEAPLRLTQVVEGASLTVYGRADGLCREQALVEEIKSTQLSPRAIGQHDVPAHWAQAVIYAHMLAAGENRPRVTVRLIYVSLAGEERAFEEALPAEALNEQFLSYAVPYVRWQQRLEEAREKMLPTLKALSFPYPAYREGQRELAKQAYIALREHTLLLAQAPTGIGKTAAVLFAALKALGEGHVSRVFYLTARTTTRLAAEAALRRMRAGGLWLRSITLTAKEKLCPVMRGGKCDALACPLAVGYYDRRADALREALDIQALDREAVLALAARHELCPFEMQLDISENCDVVICDYNYAFDPRVKLKRFFDKSFDGALLIDEAHNLTARARDMLSAGVTMRSFGHLYNLLKKAVGKDHPLAAQARAVWQKLKLLKEERERPDWGEEAPGPLLEALEIFAETARPYLGQGGEIGACITDRFFEAMNFERAAQEKLGRYLTLYDVSEKDIRVTVWCADPAPYLSERLHRARGGVLFSATLSPMGHYARLLGVDTGHGDALLDLPSPFPREHLIALRYPLPTTYAAREQSARKVAEAILALCQAHPGNYLACFPSYAYLALVGKIISAYKGDLRLIAQRPGMTEPEREAFLAQFQPHPARGLLGLIVMGGVFSEGIDLPGDRLSGAAIVGTGFPQLSLERAALSQLLEDTGEPGDGLLGAYVYPGLTRVLQAGGRVIRTEADRGAILLIDERYLQEAYEELLPPHWPLVDVGDIYELKWRLSDFWKHA